MVRIVNGNIVEDADGNNQPTTPQDAQASSGFDLSFLQEPVVIFGHETVSHCIDSRSPHLPRKNKSSLEQLWACFSWEGLAGRFSSVFCVISESASLVLHSPLPLAGIPSSFLLELVKVSIDYATSGGTTSINTNQDATSTDVHLLCASASDKQPHNTKIQKRGNITSFVQAKLSH